MKAFPLVAAATAALALAQPATAKEVESLTACGAAGCAQPSTSPANAAVARMLESEQQSSVLGAVPLGDYYYIGIKIRGDQGQRFTFGFYYLRDQQLIRTVDRGELRSAFIRVPADAQAALASLTADVEPFAKPRVVGAMVNGKRAARPAGYAALFTRLPSTDATLGNDRERWVQISLTPNRANPWFMRDQEFLYLANSQSFFLDKPLRVNDATARQIARDAGLPVPHTDTAGWGRPLGLGILAAWLAVATVFVYGRRRRRGTTS